MSSNTVLEVKDLCKYFDVKGGMKGKQKAGKGRHSDW